MQDLVYIIVLLLGLEYFVYAIISEIQNIRYAKAIKNVRREVNMNEISEYMAKLSEIDMTSMSTKDFTRFLRLTIRYINRIKPLIDKYSKGGTVED
jgi:hypothetical protein